MTGRNAPCPCGSGKKFKRCCADKPAASATNTRNASAASRLLLEGVALHQAGRLEEAAGIYRRILDRKADDSDALHYLGLIAFQQGRYHESAALIGRAIAARDDSPAFHCNLGNALMRLGQVREALGAYRRASTLDPLFAIGFVGLASASLAADDAGGALAAASRACQLAPQLFEAWSLQGEAHYRLEQIDEADRCWSRALQLKPAAAAVMVKRANLLSRFGRVAEANALLEQAIRADPAHEPAYWSRLMNLSYLCDDARRLHEAHLAWAARFAPAAAATPMRMPAPDAGARLRIGYLSADLRRHAMRFFVRPLLRHHDRSRFEVFCYSTAIKTDEVSDALRVMAEHWVDCGDLGDPELAARIAADRIDILVDLCGHSAGGRMHMLALKPAPIQVTMLGYLCTTGLRAIDYRVVDRHTCPPGLADEASSEALLRLPDCQWCYEADEPPPAVGPLPAGTRGFVTFGCVHNLAKVTPAQLGLFARILAELAQARLLVVAWGRAPQLALLKFFDERGLGARVRIVDPLPHAGYLSLHDEIDLMLDAFPYSGGTTSFEALHMGVPVVTLGGQTQASRGGVSILRNLGLDEWIARDGDDFVARAIRLATDIGRLGELRSTLRTRLQASALMDGARYTAALEALFLGTFDAGR